MLRFEYSTKQEVFEAIASMNAEIPDPAKKFMVQKIIQVEKDLFLAFDDREEWNTWRNAQTEDVYKKTAAAKKAAREEAAAKAEADKKAEEEKKVEA